MAPVHVANDAMGSRPIAEIRFMRVSPLGEASLIDRLRSLKRNASEIRDSHPALFSIFPIPGLPHYREITSHSICTRQKERDSRTESLQSWTGANVFPRAFLF